VNLHNSIFNQKSEHNELMAELNGIKNEISESKRAIGQVLNDISERGP
jgi:hypothetical protein